MKNERCIPGWVSSENRTEVGACLDEMGVRSERK